MPVDATPFTGRVLMPDGFLQITTTYPILPPGQFKVTEVNPNPVTGNSDQWFELESSSANPIDLNGWAIDFGGGNTHTIAGPAVLPANGRLVFGKTAMAADGVPVDYVYGTGFTVASGGSLGVKVPGNAATYASLVIPTGLKQGYSWQTGPLATGFTGATGVTSLECPAWSHYGSHGLHGTPGAPNVACPSFLAPSSIPANFEPIAATGTRICASNSDYSVDAVTPALPFNLMNFSVPTLYVNANGHISPTAYTCTGTSCYDTNPTAPNASTTPLATIAPFWDDLVSPGVYWQSKDPDGVPGDGDEYTIISWENTTRKGSGDSLNFQVKFFANGAVEFHYGTMTGDHGSGATTWLEEPTSRAAWIFNLNSNTSPGIASNSAIRFTLQ
jgi:hypothetical protein